jgi:hypothetical protein
LIVGRQLASNTGAGRAQGAEALSGLARTFFYAGARSLLISHWEVASESTVKLITKAIDGIRPCFVAVHECV